MDCVRKHREQLWESDFHPSKFRKWSIKSWRLRRQLCGRAYQNLEGYGWTSLAQICSTSFCKMNTTLARLSRATKSSFLVFCIFCQISPTVQAPGAFLRPAGSKKAKNQKASKVEPSYFFLNTIMSVIGLPSATFQPAYSFPKAPRCPKKLPLYLFGSASSSPLLV